MSHLPAPIDQTDELEESSHDLDLPRPGLVVVFSGAAATLRVLLVTREPVLVGRFRGFEDPLSDTSMSRQHARISLDGELWTIEDLNSVNGTFIDGVRVETSATVRSPRVLRFGNTVALPVADVRPFLLGNILTHDCFVRGPKTSKVFDQIANAGRSGGNLLIEGGTGTGKEAAAKAFAQAWSPHKPFVTVNLASLTEDLVYPTLNGSEKGAFTHAIKDRKGAVREAEGGVLFLDEVGALKKELQPMLLRLIQNKEVLPVGASAPVKVDVRFCFATNRDLAEAVRNGTFCDDFFFRLSERKVTLPLLRERPEEIPSLIAAHLETGKSGLMADGAFVEACILRSWPGNIRELGNAVTQAVAAAQAEPRPRLRASHLDPRVGVEGDEVITPPPRKPKPPKEEVERALREANGVQAQARRLLGLKHSEDLRRLMKRYGLTSDGEQEG